MLDCGNAEKTTCVWHVRTLPNLVCTAAPQVKAWQCQLALALIQVSSCCGSVYLKRALRAVDGSRGQHFHPIVYAFIREAVAAPIMCSMAWGLNREFPCL